MTLQDSQEITCPECANKQSVIIYQTLNVDLNPTARDDLFEGNINIFDCEKSPAQKQVKD